MTSSALLECVPNISAGRDIAVVDAVAEAIARVPGAYLLHRTSDVDHNRSVFTFAGSPDAVAEAAISAVQRSLELIDLTQHRGVHPRVGVLDVLPFIPIREMTLPDAVQVAHQVGSRIWNELGIPVYFYEAAAQRAGRTKLEDVRKGGFEKLQSLVLMGEEHRPDIGGPSLHPKAGAVIVGARKFLIAFNINLKSKDLSLARSIAARIRERNGGLPGIKALGLPLASRDLVQVSLNVTDFEKTSLQTVYDAVEASAAASGVEIEESELIGLIPQDALPPGAVNRLKLRKFTPEHVLENRLAVYNRTESNII